MKKGTLKSLTLAAAFMLVVVGSSTAIVTSGGVAVETGGVKISLDLHTPTGAKVIFQRAD